MEFIVDNNTASAKKRWALKFNSRLRDVGNYCIVLNHHQAVPPEPFDYIAIHYCKKTIFVNADDVMYDNRYKKQLLDEIVLFLNADAYDFIKIHKQLKVLKGYPIHKLA